MGETIGKITEVAGRVTGDREVEAKGRVEQDAADPAEPVDDPTEGAVDDETQAVRREHHDID
jgi:uncharacterized protein YjbJ (UPF0337 family)